MPRSSCTSKTRRVGPIHALPTLLIPKYTCLPYLYCLPLLMVVPFRSWILEELPPPFFYLNLPLMCTGWSLEELSRQCGLNSDVVGKRMMLWVNHGVVQVTADQEGQIHYQLIQDQHESEVGTPIYHELTWYHSTPCLCRGYLIRIYVCMCIYHYISYHYILMSGLIDRLSWVVHLCRMLAPPRRAGGGRWVGA